MTQFEHAHQIGTSYFYYDLKGNESSQDEKASSAINAVKLDDEVGGKAIQVRVVQGKEPRHFIKMFGGKMIVFSGGKVRKIHWLCYFIDFGGTNITKK